MRELSLFTGAGGGVLGSKILGWETVGYVEWEEYPQKVIAQRIKDGIFDRAPIFGNIQTLIGDGYARRYRGMVDVVTGGFPCQPFSVAGKRKSSDDSRNMWPATMDVVKAVRPPIVYLENVPGLLSAKQEFCGNCGESEWKHRPQLCWKPEYFGSRCGVCETPMDAQPNESVHYFGTILRDLAESGYDVKWCVLGADDVGAPHHRKRLWILGVHADAKHNGLLALPKSGSQEPSVFHKPEGKNCSSKLKRVGPPRNVANPLGIGQSRPRKSFKPVCSASHQNWEASYVESVRVGSVWSIEPGLGRVANGVADRANRLEATGNGQVPLTMAAAYEILLTEFIKCLTFSH